jgi:hypothetical protein
VLSSATLAAKALRAVTTAKRAQGIAGSVAEGVMQSLGSWRDPVAKLRRRRKRARVALYLRAVSTIFVAALAWVAFRDGDTLIGVLIALFTAALVFTVVRTGLLVWHLHRIPLPEPAPPLPPVGSGARKPMEILAARERTLGELLILLGPAAGDTAAEARGAATVIRQCAHRVVTLESAKRDAPADASPDLQEAVGMAQTQLDSGVAAYEHLVSAAAKAVSASSASGNPAAALTDVRLREAADALTGLAAGMREINAR